MIRITMMEKVFPFTIILTEHFYSGRIKVVRHVPGWYSIIKGNIRKNKSNNHLDH